MSGIWCWPKVVNGTTIRGGLTIWKQLCMYVPNKGNNASTASTASSGLELSVDSITSGLVLQWVLLP
jgi:hypothetical protein